ncbi:MAG: hypothetical protein IJ934_00365, partial [Acetobacter sp.]|nr:hypothetical protein [Acetobacter sp.]
VNDERNGPVIRANIAKAFCLVAYNAEETDRTKQKTLLNEVVNQVMALSYTPPCISLSEEDICVDSALQEDASQEPVSYGHVSSVQRMLFLLNRIDAFWRDKDPIASLNKFRSDITNQLHERLEKALPEHKEVIENIKLTQICSLPALLAVEADRLWEDPEKQTEILEKLEKFQQIFPEDYFDNLPRHFEQLTKGQRKDLITQALESSHSKEFEKYLSSYIATHLPEIVIGGPVNVVSRACGEFLGELRDLVTLYEEELKFGIMTSFYEQIRRKLIALSSYHSVEDFSHL